MINLYVFRIVYLIGATFYAVNLNIKVILFSYFRLSIIFNETHAYYDTITNSMVYKQIRLELYFIFKHLRNLFVC